MEPLIHNQTFNISGGELSGLYRVFFYDAPGRVVAVVRIGANILAEADVPETQDGATKQASARPTTLSGQLNWFSHADLMDLKAQGLLTIVELARDNFADSAADDAIYERRKQIMEDFLRFDMLMRTVLETGSIAALALQAMRTHGASKSAVYKYWTLLCRHGFSVDSLRSRMDRCGAPGVVRPCSNDGNKKNGRKTNAERVANQNGTAPPPAQPGMTEEWRQLILMEDNKIPSPKPQLVQRYDKILKSFRKYYRDDDSSLTPSPLEKGEYPNIDQVRRVLNVEIPRLERVRQKTTEGHFALHHRPLRHANWKGVSGPGHTWAIDSTIADMYLRSSINRTWHIGRPIVYVIVDVWSTAIVGFYVCLRGPSWDMAKVAIFNAVGDTKLFGQLWNFVPVESLYPHPTLPAVILSDRGEYLSFAAKETAFEIIDNLSLAAPYRADWKGCVEVIHRIEKDHQVWVPGAIDARRKEYELRKFDPKTAIFTVAEYTQYLYNTFKKYNLTANRQPRIDTHMIADGVPATPAGLWRWGHEMGIGTQRKFSQEDLIEKLLVPGKATVRLKGIFFEQLLYESDATHAANWTGEARNFGSWSLDCHHYPGSVSRIWIPDTIKGSGQLELTLSPQAKASASQTFEEVEDAFTYQSLDRGETQHRATVARMKINDENDALVAKARAATVDACLKQSGDTPSQSEARNMEAKIARDDDAVPPLLQAPAVEPQSRRSNNTQMRNAILAAIQKEQESA